MNLSPQATVPPTDANALIVLHGLVKTFGFRPILRGLDLRVERGDCVALLGANGSGKTTLLRVLATLSRPSAGDVRVGGWRLPQEASKIRPFLGYLGHLPLLYADLTAVENLRFFARLYRISPDSILPTLDQVGLLKRANDRAGTFSRGMQQRLGLARALLHNPDILLLDEPYTGLDVAGAALLDAVITAQAAAGKTIVFTSHDLDRTLRLARRVLFLQRGVIAHEATSASLTPLDLATLYTEIVR
jgi:heme exporter protein A